MVEASAGRELNVGYVCFFHGESQSAHGDFDFDLITPKHYTATRQLGMFDFYRFINLKLQLYININAIYQNESLTKEWH